MHSQILFISDIHGYLYNLENVWNNIKNALGQAALKQATVVFMGDYCDKGPNTKGVIDWLVQLKAEREQSSPGKTVFLTGNHDFAMAFFWLPANGF